MELWTISDVMAFAKLKSKTTVYKLIRERGLSYIKIDKSIRFNPETTIQFFLSMEVK